MSDEQKELAEVIAKFLAEHLKANAAMFTALMSLLVRNNVVSSDDVRSFVLDGLEDISKAQHEFDQEGISGNALAQLVRRVREDLFHDESSDNPN